MTIENFTIQVQKQTGSVSETNKSNNQLQKDHLRNKFIEENDIRTKFTRVLMQLDSVFLHALIG